MKLLNRKLSRFKAATRLPPDLVKFRYLAGQRRGGRGGEGEGGDGRGRRVNRFNVVYRLGVKEQRNVSESFGRREFVTRSTPCKNTLDTVADLHSLSIAPSIINISFAKRNSHPSWIELAINSFAFNCFE